MIQPVEHEKAGNPALRETLPASRRREWGFDPE
jgi:hypothetical protein